jgi:hypothetical protein
LEFITHTLAVSHPHDSEIFFGELHLVLNRYLRFAVGFERKTQEIAEHGENGIGLVRGFVNETCDGVEGVEKEMWLQLRLQCLQVRAGQLARANFGAPIETQGVRGTHNHDVDWDFDAGEMEKNPSPMVVARTAVLPAARSFFAEVGRQWRYGPGPGSTRIFH